MPVFIKRRFLRLVRPARSLVPGVGLVILAALVFEVFLPQVNKIITRPAQSLHTPTIPKLPLLTPKNKIPTVTSIPKTPQPSPAPAPSPPPPPPPPPKPKPVIKPIPSSSVSNFSPTPSSTGSSSGSSTTTSGSSSSTSTTISYPPADYSSSNWSGYFAHGGSYTQVSASWVVPSPTGNGSSTSADATWIGIGGITTSDLIQIGTDDTVSANGQVTSAAFYEMLPDSAITISSMHISSGDTIQAAVNQTTTGEWNLSITDTTSNQTFSMNVAYNSSLSSAEWIEEDPSDTQGNLLPLDNFGTVDFTQASTLDSNVAQNLTESKAYSIDMVNSSNQTVAATSSIGSDNASFSVEHQ